ncbi:hypothetical protein IWQ60_000082 [Tieghemiomyces parasiticus]|uniref:DUF202 domain-containing protein n=1 Tax=Tieghemiomyces parasiticus TaxID=78921 RepID=A0A9W8E373_9FUNG|nr:hypothetical protein IWQ60_000082 [Tieghemiomyces parasiticus]
MAPVPHHRALPHQLSVARDHLSYERTFLSFFRLSLTAAVLGAALYLNSSKFLDVPTGRALSYTWFGVAFLTFILTGLAYLTLLRGYWTSQSQHNHHVLFYVVTLGALAVVYVTTTEMTRGATTHYADSVLRRISPVTTDKSGGTFTFMPSQEETNMSANLHGGCSATLLSYAGRMYYRLQGPSPSNISGSEQALPTTSDFTVHCVSAGNLHELYTIDIQAVKVGRNMTFLRGELSQGTPARVVAYSTQTLGALPAKV